MDTSNDNIRKLYEMLDNPTAYSEQEIHDIIDCDEESRETYRMNDTGCALLPPSLVFSLFQASPLLYYISCRGIL